MTGRGGSGGTIAVAGRSFAGLASRGGGGGLPGAGIELVERQAGADPPDLIGVERLARQQRVGHVEQLLLVLGQTPAARASSCRSTNRFTSWSIRSAVSSL